MPTTAATGTLGKPFDVDDLYAVVEQQLTLAYWCSGGASWTPTRRSPF
jgi:hypothetical protein